MQKITTFLWFDNQAEQAMNFYTSIFKIRELARYHAMATPDRDRRVRSWLAPSI
jgi:predicted 3-demethylubiquinone-9 3-methyltransferase (glyoxalase superfamily)